jgi:hypothetical protein
LEAVAADPDAVAQRPVVAQHEIEKPLRRADDDGPGRLGSAEEHELPLVGRGQLLLFRRGHGTGLLLDGHFVGLRHNGTLRLRRCGEDADRQQRPAQ